MTHWKLILAYDGTTFHGWQVQPGLPTVQGLLADAIRRIVGEHILPQGSGRTDAGVHALGQVASFALAAPIPPANLHRALNRCLPPSIRVLRAEVAAPDFHARHSAIRKTYEYRIFRLKQACAPGASHLEMCVEAICPPTLAPYVWPCPWPLGTDALDALNHAARHILGVHDFTTFAASDPDLAARIIQQTQTPPPIRSVFYSRWHVRDNLLIYQVTANGFLHHMVRNLVGTLIQCGAHRLDPDSIPTLLSTRDRSAAGPTAPPTGLFLVNVEYPDPVPTSDTPQPATLISL